MNTKIPPTRMVWVPCARAAVTAPRGTIVEVQEEKTGKSDPGNWLCSPGVQLFGPTGKGPGFNNRVTQERSNLAWEGITFKRGINFSLTHLRSTGTRTSRPPPPIFSPPGTTPLRRLGLCARGTTRPQGDPYRSQNAQDPSNPLTSADASIHSRRLRLRICNNFARPHTQQRHGAGVVTGSITLSPHTIVHDPGVYNGKSPVEHGGEERGGSGGPASATLPLYLRMTHPHVLYALGYLVSAVARRDSVGRKPKRKTFVLEGLGVVEREALRELRGVLRPPKFCFFISKLTESLADSMCELIAILDEVIGRARTHAPFGGTLALHITLLHAQLEHAQGHAVHTRTCYRVAAQLVTEAKDTGGEAAARAEEAALLVGLRARAREMMDEEEEEAQDAKLVRLGQEVAETCRGLGGAMRAVGKVIEGVLTTEILRAKQYFKHALTYTTETHLRALVLALIAAHHFVRAACRRSRDAGKEGKQRTPFEELHKRDGREDLAKKHMTVNACTAKNTSGTIWLVNAAIKQHCRALKRQEKRWDYRRPKFQGLFLVYPLHLSNYTRISVSMDLQYCSGDANLNGQQCRCRRFILGEHSKCSCSHPEGYHPEPNVAATPVPPPLTVASIVASYQDPNTILKKPVSIPVPVASSSNFAVKPPSKAVEIKATKAAAQKETNAGLKRKNIDDPAPAKAKIATKRQRLSEGRNIAMGQLIMIVTKPKKQGLWANPKDAQIASMEHHGLAANGLRRDWSFNINWDAAEMDAWFREALPLFFAHMDRTYPLDDATDSTPQFHWRLMIRSNSTLSLSPASEVNCDAKEFHRYIKPDSRRIYLSGRLYRPLRHSTSRWNPTLTYETMEEEESEGEWEPMSEDSGDEAQQKRDQKRRKHNARGKAKVKASKSHTPSPTRSLISIANSDSGDEFPVTLTTSAPPMISPPIAPAVTSAQPHPTLGTATATHSTLAMPSPLTSGHTARFSSYNIYSTFSNKPFMQWDSLDFEVDPLFWTRAGSPSVAAT
ncbi:hypothetical protein C8F04DRAFT_1232712 [Mycena alexandri]|uniref:Uncharacterized protein n=1 Tax=Mycena alexandri TaxID=1745969 RepID=A0AAD6T091_9AGAR|nr:hypothetical protein C8F04DRAFT_1232712 [Mycena alexandri]